jgi:hypothetical protein
LTEKGDIHYDRFPEVTMAERRWKKNKDLLFRGDMKDCVRPPVPDADDSIVRHILYLEGPGRETPYLSTTEVEGNAKHFAGKTGAVWNTTVPTAEALNVGHIPKNDLLSLLNGKGKGKAKWDSAYEVMNAKKYVEQWAEHLLNFKDVSDVKASLKRLFKKS